MATTNQAPAGASAGKPLPFTIGEITKAEPPSGAETKNWYRYTITRGSQRAVVGHRQGSLKSVKGIGWFIEEYGVAQISMNLTDLSVTPVHAAFDACVERADARSSTLRISPVSYLMAPARSAWPGRGMVTGSMSRSRQFFQSRFSITIAIGLPVVSPFITPPVSRA